MAKIILPDIDEPLDSRSRIILPEPGEDVAISVPYGMTRLGVGKTSFTDLLKAYFENESISGSATRFLTEKVALLRIDDEEGYSPFDDPQLMRFTDEEKARLFGHSKSHGQTAIILDSLESERRAKEIIEAEGFSMRAMAAGLVSQGIDIYLTFKLAAIAAPAIGAVAIGSSASAAGRTIFSTFTTTAAKAAGALAVEETALQLTQREREIEQSAITVIGGGLLGGIIGVSSPIGRKFLKSNKKEVEQAIAGTAEELLRPPTPKIDLTETMVTDNPLTYDGNGITGKIIKHLAPSQRMEALSAEDGATMRKILRSATFGETDQSVELLIRRWDIGKNRIIKSVHDGYAKFIKRASESGAEKISREEYNKYISRIVQDGADESIPERFGYTPDVEDLNIAKAVKKYFADFLKEGKEIGIFDRNISEAGDYFTHLWDIEAINMKPKEFIDDATEMFMRLGAPDEDSARDMASNMLNRVALNKGFMHEGIKIDAPQMKGRKIKLENQDPFVRKWAVQDIEAVVSKYQRNVAPRLELARKANLDKVKMLIAKRNELNISDNPEEVISKSNELLGSIIDDIIRSENLETMFSRSNNEAAEMSMVDIRAVKREMRKTMRASLKESVEAFIDAGGKGMDDYAGTVTKNLDDLEKAIEKSVNDEIAERTAIVEEFKKIYGADARSAIIDSVAKATDEVVEAARKLSKTIGTNNAKVAEMSDIAELAMRRATDSGETYAKKLMLKAGITEDDVPGMSDLIMRAAAFMKASTGKMELNARTARAVRKLLSTTGELSDDVNIAAHEAKLLVKLAKEASISSEKGLKSLSKLEDMLSKWEAKTSDITRAGAARKKLAREEAEALLKENKAFGNEIKLAAKEMLSEGKKEIDDRLNSFVDEAAKLIETRTMAERAAALDDAIDKATREAARRAISGQHFIDEVTERYIAKLKNAKNDKEAREIVKKMNKARNHVSKAISLITGNYTDINDKSGIAKISDNMLKYNFMTRMGMFAVSQMCDFSTLLIRHGFGDNLKAALSLAKNLKNKEFRELMSEIRVASDAIENISNRMSMAIGEFGPEYLYEAGLAGLMNKGVSLSRKLFLMDIWSDGYKSFAGLVGSTFIHRAATEGATEFELGVLKTMGISASDLAQMAKLPYKKFNSISVPVFHRWPEELANKYQVALSQMASSAANEPGKGMKPFFSNTVFGKMMLQFKSFYFGYMQNTLMFVEQKLRKGTTREKASVIAGVASAIGIGGLSYVTREYSYGREVDFDDVDSLVYNSIDKSGLLVMFTEPSNIIESFTDNEFGIRPMFGVKAPSQRFLHVDPVGALLGPSAQTGRDIALAAQESGIFKGEAPSSRFYKFFFRLIPYNNAAMLMWAYSGTDVLGEMITGDDFLPDTPRTELPEMLGEDNATIRR